MTKRDAEAIARRITKYWWDRGCTVNAWVEREPYVEGVNEVGFTVRTDMVRGLPRKAPKDIIHNLIREQSL